MNASDDNKISIDIRSSKWSTATRDVTLHSKRDKIGTGFGIRDNSSSRKTS